MRSFGHNKDRFAKRQKKGPFSMAIRNELHEYFPEHLRMGTTKIKYFKGREEECMKRRVKMKGSIERVRKKEVPTA